MKIQTVQIDMEALGAQFANMDDKEQALFFKGLAAELKTWPSIHQGEMQFCSVGCLLNDDQKKILSRVVEMAWYKEDA
jgi:hypothetical protein